MRELESLRAPDAVVDLLGKEDIDTHNDRVRKILADTEEVGLGVIPESLWSRPTRAAFAYDPSGPLMRDS